MAKIDKIHIRTAWRRMQVYLAIHHNIVMRNGKMKHVCKAYANAVGIELNNGKHWHIAFLLEQYNNPESKIYKGLPPIKSPFKTKPRKKVEKVNKRQLYENYLKSKKWIDFRNSIKEKRGNKCEICNIKGVVLHGHHLTYERLMNELETDIQIVCLRCHEEIHGRKFKPSRSETSKKKK